MEDNTKGLQEKLGEIFAGNVKYVFDKERNDSKYMNQTILGTRFRAFIGISVMCIRAFKEMYKLLALSIAVHREQKHNEDKSKTIASLSRSMTPEAIKDASSRSYWNG